MKPNSKIAAALTLSAIALSGCYVVPVVDTQGGVQYQHYVAPGGVPVVAAPAAYPASTTYPVPYPAPAGPMVLNARLYPDNELATQTGVVTGTVANMMTGKGRFQVQYGSEILTGEATRVSNDERRGIASAFGSSGSYYMSCVHRLNPQPAAVIHTHRLSAKSQITKTSMSPGLSAPAVQRPHTGLPQRRP